MAATQSALLPAGVAVPAAAGTAVQAACGQRAAVQPAQPAAAGSAACARRHSAPAQQVCRLPQHSKMHRLNSVWLVWLVWLVCSPCAQYVARVHSVWLVWLACSRCAQYVARVHSVSIHTLPAWPVHTHLHGFLLPMKLGHLVQTVRCCTRTQFKVLQPCMCCCCRRNILASHLAGARPSAPPVFGDQHQCERCFQQQVRTTTLMIPATSCQAQCTLHCTSAPH